MGRPKKVIPEADMALWHQYLDEGDQQARDELILHYQPLVLATARMVGRRIGWRATQEELVSSGQPGLIKAVDSYDPERGVFKKFASTYIFGGMIDALRRGDWLPRKFRAAQKEIQRAADVLGDYTIKEMADYLGWEEDEVSEVLVNTSRAEVGTLPENSDILPQEDAGRDILLVFLKVFDQLPFHQQLIIALRYYGDSTLSEVGRIIPKVLVSREHNDAIQTIFTGVQESIVGE